MKPDICIKVRFKTSAEGGRQTPLRMKAPFGVDFYACPLIANNTAYDCRLLVGDRVLELGEYYEVSVKFLNRDLALPNLFIGQSIALWEGKEVANGEIIKIF